MRTLTKEQIESINKEYTADAAEAMLNLENADKVLSYVERAAEQGVVLTYNQAFWANKGVAVYVKDNHLCIFSDSTLSGLTPLSAAYAEGDWQDWLKDAKPVIRVKGWK